MQCLKFLPSRQRKSAIFSKNLLHFQLQEHKLHCINTIEINPQSLKHCRISSTRSSHHARLHHLLINLQPFASKPANSNHRPSKRISRSSVKIKAETERIFFNPEHFRAADPSKSASKQNAVLKPPLMSLLQPYADPASCQSTCSCRSSLVSSRQKESPDHR